MICRILIPDAGRNVFKERNLDLIETRNVLGIASHPLLLEGNDKVVPSHLTKFIGMDLEEWEISNPLDRVKVVERKVQKHGV